MPSQRFSTTVLAGTVNTNIVAGSQFEFLARPSRIQIYQVADIVLAASAGPGESTVFFGQELELAASPTPQGVAGLGPTVPDDLILDDIGAPGDRLVIRLAETGGVDPLIARTLLVITPI